MSENDTKVVKVKEPVYNEATAERDERGMGSLNAVIEGWRHDAMMLRALDLSDFKAEIQTRNND